ncbi:unnamed protein product [Prorocentrum cordatum]|uniref:Uncharacterized protein n=1 Tax=Prorocentrum cordatum TaxID=2364126 RepID=A0ABN9U2J0_9DINO|nr:unnamed protein product [Polarella glacialis]
MLHGLLPDVPRHICSKSERVLLDYQQVCQNYYGTAGSGSTMGVPIVVQDAQADRLLRQWESLPKKERDEFKQWQQRSSLAAPLLRSLAEDPRRGGADLADKLWRMTSMAALEPAEGRTLHKRLTALRNVQTQVEIARAHGMAVIPNEGGLSLSCDELRVIDAVAQEQKRHWFHAAAGLDESVGREAASNLAHLIWWHMACMEDGAKAWKTPGGTLRQRRFGRIAEAAASDGEPDVESPAVSPGMGPPQRSRSSKSGASASSDESPHAESAGFRRPKRVVLFSGHDTTVMALAAKLGFNLPPPKFGGYLLFELHDGGQVKCKYNQDPSKRAATASSLTSRQLPKDPSKGFVEFDDLPEGSTPLKTFKERCQNKAMKSAARRLGMLERTDSWSRSDGEGSESSSSRRSGTRALGASLLQGMDPLTRDRAEVAFKAMDPSNTGSVSVKSLTKTANELGVEISPEALQLAAECFGDEGGSQFTRERFLELWALLDQAYLGWDT